MATPALSRKNLLQKLWALQPADRVLLCETAFWLAVAAVAIAILPFERLGRMAAISPSRRVLVEPKRMKETRRIRWAIMACGSRMPWRAMCFEQGLAAQFMLRRRGIPSVLYYGAAPDRDRGVSAHVWVRDRDIDVVGCEIASQFAVLATFPAPTREGRS